MKRENSSGNQTEMVSASDLSQMGVCERLVRFEARYGKRPSPCQRQAMARGRMEHDKIFKDSVRTNPVLKTSLEKPWCFIASATFGPQAKETQTLRLFRDRILRKAPTGRAVMRMYYRISPGICRWLTGKKTAVAMMRTMMRPIVLVAGAIVEMAARRSKDES